MRFKQRKAFRKCIIGAILIFVGFALTEYSGVILVKAGSMNLGLGLYTALFYLVMFGGTPFVFLGGFILLVNFIKWVFN